MGETMGHLKKGGNTREAVLRTVCWMASVVNLTRLGRVTSAGEFALSNWPVSMSVRHFLKLLSDVGGPSPLE